MSGFLKDALSALPSVASHPLALVGYLVTVIAAFLIKWKTQRFKLLLTNIEKLPESERMKAIKAELGPVRVPPKLTPEQWLKSRIHFYYFLAFALVCLVIITLFAFATTAPTPAPAAIKIVDISIDDQKRDSFPIMEIKVRNIGGRIGFLKAIELHVSKIDNLISPTERLETHVDVTWHYDTSLSLLGAPYVRKVEIAQKVKPDDVDRFTVTLAYDEMKMESYVQDLARSLAVKAVTEGKKVDMDTITKHLDSLPPEKLLGLYIEKERAFSLVEMKIVVLYNEDNKTEVSEPIMFVMPKINCFVMATAISKPNAEEIVRQNRLRLDEVQKTFQGKRSPALQSLFDGSRQE